MPTPRRARINDNDPLTPTDRVIDSYKQVASQPAESADSLQQADKLSSQPIKKSASQESEKSASQPASQPDSSSDADKEMLDERDLVTTSQQASKLTSQESDKLTIQPADNPISEEREDAEVEASQPSNKSASQEADKSTSQTVGKLVLKKATFKLDSEVITALDRYHLQLQIDLGKQDAPYKETIVEEAIAQWLEQSEKSPNRAIKSLAKRQQQR